MTHQRGSSQKGDRISITEKIDGANSSFIKDDDNFLGVSCYSRRQVLSPENTLKGFYQWVREYVSEIKDKLNPNYRYIGEWTNPHKVKYKEEHMKEFFMYSIWDEEKEQYLSDEIVISEADRLGIQLVEYFYIGEFISYGHLMSFVGKSNMTEIPNTGEGIVVKNVDYFDYNGKQVFVKLVTEEFAEVQKQRLPKNPNVDEKEIAVIKTVLTKPRIEKIMYKLVDEGFATSEEFTLSNMGKFIKLVSPIALEDMYEEEGEILSKLEDDKVKRLMGKILPLVIKDVIQNKE